MKCINMLLSMISLAGFYMASLFANPLTDEGLRLNLNSSGLNILAEEIEKSALEPVDNESISDINEKLAYGIHVEAKGIRYSINFTHLNIFPRYGSLALELGLKDIKIEISHIKLSKKVGVMLSTTCKQTQIQIARSDSLTLRAAIPLWVDEYSIQTKIEKLDFQISEKQYQVHGPNHCTGALGVGEVMKSIIHKVLSDSKQSIEDAVKQKIDIAEQQLSKELNEIAHQNFALRGRVLPGLPQIEVDLKVRPFEVQIDEKQLTIEFAIDADKDEVKLLGLENRRNNVPIWSKQDIGQAGFNPQVLNDEISDWLAMHKRGFYLDFDNFPELGGFLRKDVAVNTWPNLAFLNMTSDSLITRLEFQRSPRFVFDEASNNLQMVTNLTLAFEIEVDGVSIDYYYLNLDIVASAFLRLEGSLLEIGLTDFPTVHWEGRFAKGFDSGVDLVHDEVLNVMIHGFMKGLHKERGLLGLWLPAIQVGEKYIKPSSLYYDNPYISMTLQASDKP